MKIIVPKRFVDVEANQKLRGTPLFFLAGPVRGGGDWQHKMCLLLEERLPDCIIATPTRWDETHPLSSHFFPGVENFFHRQLNWERYYLKAAGNVNARGCIIFWLPFEDEVDPHPGPEPYSMDTRGELGDWRVKMKYENSRVVIGAEPTYYGLSQIQRNYSLELEYEFPIYETMEETADRAFAKAYA